MKLTTPTKLGFTLTGVLALSVTSYADVFGSGANAFTIDFVNIGNPGNAKDTGAGGGTSSAPYGGVPYTYRMGTYEISQDVITKATASGLPIVSAGAWSGSQPASNMTWYEMAAFVNFLNTSTGHGVAYQLDTFAQTMTLWSSGQAWQAGGENLYRNKNAYYFLPSEDEWYKAAYHKNDGVTANYWDYATASNAAPTAVANGTTAGTAVFNQPFAQGPTAVNNCGGLSAYGTMGQNGNVWEWVESATTAPNDSPSESRAERGANWNSFVTLLVPSTRFSIAPGNFYNDVGFRVASVVPEPSCAGLLMGSGMIWLLKRRRAPTQ